MQNNQKKQKQKKKTKKNNGNSTFLLQVKRIWIKKEWKLKSF